MAFYIPTTNRFFDAGTAAGASPDLLSRWMRVCVSHWQKWRSVHATGLLLECMNDSALEELGMARVGRGACWLDGREAFPRGDFEHHSLREEMTGRGAD